MPKATVPALPLSGIFAVNKPSGPTSMSLLTRLKPLFSRSRLFVPEAELDAPPQKKKSQYPGPTPADGKRQKKKPNWKKISKQYVKLGSGGTLDPLADGVLGSSIPSMEPKLTYPASHWNWVCNQAVGAIHRMHKGSPEFLFFLHRDPKLTLSIVI